ncbi:hypothetical protein AXF42_Ash021765 [Apostasia shenzhenica]|uniref:Uncharacterized protein n=1 Tax=Apostasia shenzhenica TaxID=1088818 RepID=A0A2H9ZYL6_9ASPA|nr:hypothetical protein AXF42_Ash021765 [Apostasia shenzhenica]
MCFRCGFRKILGIFGLCQRDRGQSRQNICYSEHALSEDSKRNPEAGKADQQFGQIYLEGWRSVFPFLSVFAQ